ncbi:hypothetical protein HZH66_003940 [Vespula vulgaris]|uniref:Uncharacterized protein n=1 Tax=Vespula vulgaris TaxID=7454 RepID=A0A834NEE2_VESVU|nr:hypothetical protein HZH66_003940 [Vespula vulgaris]
MTRIVPLVGMYKQLEREAISHGRTPEAGINVSATALTSVTLSPSPSALPRHKSIPRTLLICHRRGRDGDGTLNRSYETLADLREPFINVFDVKKKLRIKLFTLAPEVGTTGRVNADQRNGTPFVGSEVGGAHLRHLQCTVLVLNRLPTLPRFGPISQTSLSSPKPPEFFQTDLTLSDASDFYF